MRVGGRRCAVGRATPLSALAGTRLRLRLRDYGSCGRSPADAGSLYVRKVGPDRAGGPRGWVYKVGNRAGTTGAADPSGPFGTGRRLRGGRLLWFWCLQSRAGGCQRTLDARPEASTVAAGAPLRVRVRGYDDNGRGVPVAGALVRAGGAQALTGADGVATVTRAGGRGRRAGHGRARRHGALVPGAGGGGVRRALVLLALLLALALAGCGFGAGDAPKGAGTELTVSRNFGADEMGSSKQKRIPAGETVMRLLQRSFEVETRYGGGFVQEIDGVGGGRRDGRPVDWFFYVNGIEADQRRRRAAARGRRPRVVGPPRLGRRDAHPGGRRLLSGAVRVRAARASGCRCGSNARPTRSAPARRCGPGSRTRARRSAASRRWARRRARRCCGCWSGAGPTSAATRPRAASSRGRRPPASSPGRPPRATASRCSTPAATTVRTLGAGSGLVAATSYLDQQPTWVVAGTDDVGVAAAAAALNETRLRDHFAVAVESGREIPVPLPMGGGTASP